MKKRNESGGIIILNGNRLFPMFRWADILGKNNMLGLFVPGIYCFRRYKFVLRIIKKIAPKKLSRSIDKFLDYRTDFIPENKVITSPWSEFLSHFSYMRFLGSREFNLLSLDAYRKTALKVVQIHKPDVLFVRSCYGGTAAVVAKNQGAKIVTFHSLVHPDDLVRVANRLSKRYGHSVTNELARGDPYFRQSIKDLEIADHVVTISTHVKNSLVANGIPNKKIVVIPDGIDTLTQELSNNEGSCARPGEGKFRLLYAGSYGQRKGFIELIEVMRILGEHDIVLDAYGIDTSAQNETSKLVQESGVPIRLHPSISRRELLKEMASSTVFVFTSFAEGGARVTYEAAAMGMAIVTTLESASMVENEISGLIVEPDDPEMIARAILRLKNDRDLAEKFGRAARDEIHKNFTPEKMEERITKFFQQI